MRLVLVVYSVMFLLILLVPALGVEMDLYDLQLFKGEPIVLQVCDVPPSSALLDCYDGTPDIYPYSQQCSLLVFNSSEVTCKDPILGLNHSGGAYLKKLDIEDPLGSLHDKLDDVTGNDPVSLAQKVYAFTLIGGSRADYYLNLLKSNRDDRLKCWPQDDCDIQTTVDVLHYLDKSGLDVDSRVYKDALLWVESHQYPYEMDDWTVHFEADNSTSCYVEQDDGSLLSSCTVSDDERCDASLDILSGSRLNFTCDDDYCVMVRDSFGQRVFSGCEDDDEPLSAAIQGGCFHDTGSRHICPSGLTEKILMLSGLGDDVRVDAIKWLEDKIDTASVAGKRLTTTPEVYANLYAYDSHDDPRLLSWILFSQNNDGSFGDWNHDETFSLSLEALSILENSSSRTEWYSDALSWVLDTYFSRSSLTLEEQAMFYDFFIKKHSFLLPDGVVHSNDPTVTASLHSASDDMNVSLDTGRFNISTTESTSGMDVTLADPEWATFGYRQDAMEVSTGVLDRTYLVVFSNVPDVVFKNDSFLFFENISSIEIQAESTENVSCSFMSDSFSFLNTSLLEGVNRLTLFPEDRRCRSSEHAIDVTCSLENFTFRPQLDLNITCHDDPPFTVSQNHRTLERTDLVIHNTFNDDISVSFDMQGLSTSHPPTITLSPDERTTVSFYDADEKTSPQVILSAKGYSHRQNISFVMSAQKKQLVLFSSLVLFFSLVVLGVIVWQLRVSGIQFSDLFPQKGFSIKQRQQTKEQSEIEASADLKDLDSLSEDDRSSSVKKLSPSHKHLSRMLYLLNTHLDSSEKTIDDLSGLFSEDQRKKLYEDAKSFVEDKQAPQENSSDLK